MDNSLEHPLLKRSSTIGLKDGLSEEVLGEEKNKAYSKAVWKGDLKRDAVCQVCLVRKAERHTDEHSRLPSKVCGSKQGEKGDA